MHTCTHTHSEKPLLDTQTHVACVMSALSETTVRPNSMRKEPNACEIKVETSLHVFFKNNVLTTSAHASWIDGCNVVSLSRNDSQVD